MGRIKSRLVKRVGDSLLSEENGFSKDFDNNKKLLSGLMPSKKIRNKIAGHITRKKSIKK